MDDVLAVKLAEVDSRARSNTRRIDKLEQNTEALTRLTTSVEIMAAKIHNMGEMVGRLDEKVTILESKPGKRWDDIVSKCIWAVVGGVIVFLLAKVGIS